MFAHPALYKSCSLQFKYISDLKEETIWVTRARQYGHACEVPLKDIIFLDTLEPSH